jgi:polyisoprenoid-binding protein YceI
VGAAWIAAIPALGSGAESGLPWRLALDTQATQVRFELGATLHTVRGSFEVREGTVHFDPASGAMEGRVVIDAASGETGNEKRDENMHAWVLESDRYPEIVLVPERLDVAEASADTLRGVVEGRVEIHGGSHPVTIPVRGRRTSAGTGRVEGDFEVPYVAWGLEDPSIFLLRVDKVIAIHFEAAGVLTGP